MKRATALGGSRGRWTMPAIGSLLMVKPPRTKVQGPKKLQVPSYKIAPFARAMPDIWIWRLNLVWSLELGIGNFPVTCRSQHLSTP
jgi:hypothetical protein